MVRSVGYLPRRLRTTSPLLSHPFFGRLDSRCREERVVWPAVVENKCLDHEVGPLGLLEVSETFGATADDPAQVNWSPGSTRSPRPGATRLSPRSATSSPPPSPAIPAPISSCATRSNPIRALHKRSPFIGVLGRRPGNAPPYRIWHIPARLARHARERLLKISPNWPRKDAFLACWQCLCTLPVLT
jgi:hypothetical protein